MQPFVESGMTFGPYADGHCFRVDQSDTYKAIQNGVKMAEFLLLRPSENSPPFIWIVEAKESSPRPETVPNFKAFIGEIREKLTNAMAVGIASILNRHPAAAMDLPDIFKNLNLTTAGFRLVLIINGHQKAWLSPLQDALRCALRATTKTWSLGPNAVAVINHEDARRFGLISAS
jgi:hypothetical protein